MVQLDPVLALVCGFLIWIISLVAAFLAMILKNKYGIQEKHIDFMCDIVKYVTGALVGYLFGGVVR